MSRHCRQTVTFVWKTSSACCDSERTKLKEVAGQNSSYSSKFHEFPTNMEPRPICKSVKVATQRRYELVVAKMGHGWPWMAMGTWPIFLHPTCSKNFWVRSAPGGQFYFVCLPIVANPPSYPSSHSINDGAEKRRTRYILYL